MKIRMYVPYLIIYVFLTILAPYSLMVMTFGWKDGWLFLGMYSHLFLFPILFGVWMIPIIVQIANIVISLPATRRIIRYAIVFTLTATVVACFYEFEGRPAVFELSTAIVKSPLSESSGDTILDYLRITKPPKTKVDLFIKKIPSNSWFFFNPKASPVKYAYAASFILQTFIGISILLLFSWSARLMFMSDPDYMRTRQKLIPLMLWTLILYLPWFIMRVTFEGYKGTIYPGSERPSVLLAIPFILATLYLTAVTWKVVGEKLDSAVGLISSLGITGLCFQDNWREALFPRTPSVRHYLLMWLIIAVLLFCFIAPYQRKNGSEPPH